MKSTVACDVEIYGNFLLIGFCNVDTKNIRVFKAFGADVALTDAEIKIIRNILSKQRLITFNGKNFDIPMITCALKGMTCKQLKEVSDAIIMEGLRFWHVEKRFGVKVPRDDAIDHIDLIDVAFGQASLKLYGGRIHSKKIQDLPFDPARILSEQDTIDLEDYWNNDIKTTLDLMVALKPELELREEMSKEFGIDLRSKSDAQIAEAVIKKGVAKSSGMTVTRPASRRGDKFHYRVPGWVMFTDPALQQMLEDVRAANFIVDETGSVLMPQVLEGRKITLGKSVYRMGIGGLHSTEEKIAHIATDDVMLVEKDVTSYYPSLILNQQLYPQHIGKEFLKIYRDIYVRRVSAKKRGDKKLADMLKTPILGVFGKFGSKWSILYSPELLIQVTMSGQIALLMLIEMLEQNVYVEVVSANTDGIMIKCDRHVLDWVRETVEMWEIITDLSTEEKLYSSIHCADVNNYVAVEANGAVKTKGKFTFDGLRKNPTNMICNDAVINYLTLDISPEHTMAACQDVRRFVTIRRVAGGGVTETGEYLGKAIRSYYSTKNKESCIRDAKSGNLVARSTGSAPLMELPEGNVLPDDLDVSWYVSETLSILKDIGAMI